MITVIVAVYNSSNYLQQCLDSICAQTLREIEILCVNDGSTDNSLDILNEYAEKDKRVKVFTKENEGKGAASARNVGLDNATGEYVAVLDSDDWFEPLHLQRLYERAKETNADVVICDAQGFDSRTGNPTYNAVCFPQRDVPDKYVFSVEDYPEKIFQISTTAAWNGLYRRDFVEQYHLRFQRVIMTDDLYFSFSSRVLAKRISVVNEKLIHYRMNAGGSQSDLLTQYPDSAYPAFIEMKESLQEWGLYEKTKQSLINSAANTFRGAYDRIKEYQAFEDFHNELVNEIFNELEIADKSEEYFYDYRIYQWIKLVCDNTANEVLFLSARGYQAPMTTGILRFQIPQEYVERETIELKTGNIESVYYYVQMMFLGIEDRVKWI